MTDCNNNKNNNNKSISTTALATAIPTTFIPSTSKYNLILNYKDHLSILFISSLIKIYQNKIWWMSPKISKTVCSRL